MCLALIDLKRRRLIAIGNASRHHSARRWSTIAQPTIRRENRCITIARFKNPYVVGT